MGDYPLVHRTGEDPARHQLPVELEGLYQAIDGKQVLERVNRVRKWRGMQDAVSTQSVTPGTKWQTALLAIVPGPGQVIEACTADTCPISRQSAEHTAWWQQQVQQHTQCTASCYMTFPGLTASGVVFILHGNVCTSSNNRCKSPKGSILGQGFTLDLEGRYRIRPVWRVDGTGRRKSNGDIRP